MMKVCGYIQLILCALIGVVLTGVGIRDREVTNIILGVVLLITGPIQGLAVVYASYVPDVSDTVDATKKSSDSNSKSIIRMSDEIKTLQNQVKELKEIIKNIQK